MQGEHQYSLDCMIELGAISPAEQEWFVNIAHNPDEIMERLSKDANNSISTRDHFEHLQQFERDVSDYAYEGIANSSEKQQVRCYLTDVRCHRFAITAVCDTSDDIFDTSATRIIRSLNRSFAAVRKASESLLLTAVNTWRQDIIRKERLAKAALSKRFHDSDVLKYFHFRDSHKRRLKAKRTAFEKSFLLARSVLGPEKLDEVLKLRQMEVEGELYRYRLTLKSPTLLTSGGHGKTTLTVLTLDGTEICDLCISSDDCTLLDHLISIYTHVKMGEELEILQTGNVFNVRNEAVEEHADFISGGRMVRIDPQLYREMEGYAVKREADRERREKVLLPQLDLSGINPYIENLFDRFQGIYSR